MLLPLLLRTQARTPLFAAAACPSRSKTLTAPFCLPAAAADPRQRAGHPRRQAPAGGAARGLLCSQRHRHGVWAGAHTGGGAVSHQRHCWLKRASGRKGCRESIASSSSDALGPTLVGYCTPRPFLLLPPGHHWPQLQRQELLRQAGKGKAGGVRSSSDLGNRPFMACSIAEFQRAAPPSRNGGAGWGDDGPRQRPDRPVLSRQLATARTCVLAAHPPTPISASLHPPINAGGPDHLPGARGKLCACHLCACGPLRPNLHSGGLEVCSGCCCLPRRARSRSHRARPLAQVCPRMPHYPCSSYRDIQLLLSVCPGVALHGSHAGRRRPCRSRPS